MTISYKGISIVRKGDGLHYKIGWMQRGPFEHYQDAQDDIDQHVMDHDDENIYASPSIRQSIEEDRRG